MIIEYIDITIENHVGNTKIVLSGKHLEGTYSHFGLFSFEH